MVLSVWSQKQMTNVCSGSSHPHDLRKLKCQYSKWLSLISRVLFTLNSFYKAKRSITLIIWKYQSSYVKLYVQKGLKFGLTMDSLPWQCSSKQGTLCQAVSGSKTDYWNGTPILFPWLGSDWLLAVSKNKVCFKGMKTSGYWRHLENVTSTESHSTTGVPKMFPTVAALLG
jgi:hypothetical protein